MPNEEIILNASNLKQSAEIQEMIRAGVFFGRRKSKLNPRMKPYIFGIRGSVAIIDLEKILETLNGALGFLGEKLNSNTQTLIVATQPAAAEEVARFGQEFGIPYIINRWIGGLLTNFPVIAKRLEYYKKLKSDLERGAFVSLLKKEQHQLKQELEKLEMTWSGLEKLERRPDILVIINPAANPTAIREARRLGVPVVAFANTDSDPGAVDYPVIGNTQARASVSWFFGKLKKVFEEAKTKSAATAGVEQNTEKIADMPKGIEADKEEIKKEIGSSNNK